MRRLILCLFLATCVFGSSINMTTATTSRRSLNKLIQAKTKAKEVRTGDAVTKRAERLKQTNKAFRQAVKDLEDRGLRSNYSAGICLFFAKQQHHASRSQDVLMLDDG
ncbi:MAG TPA: hypothetical protein VJ875_19395, partial [Pyrinomonadaceae bacterium]|nr:hypothetical protein [Pyrinomonadaceae bacterium]